MSTTVKRISVSLTKENYHELETLMKFLGENQAGVFKRALRTFYAECERRKDFIKFINEEK